MTLSEKTIGAIRKLQEIYPNKRSALVPALFLAQKEKGYLSRETQNAVADMFDVDPNEVNGIVTFYELLFDKPVGMHQLFVCKNVACMLRGSDELLEKICEKLGVSPGGTTEDKEFTVLPSECLAACDRAPMLLGDDVVYGPVKEEDLDAVLDNIRNGRGCPCPISVEEDDA